MPLDFAPMASFTLHGIPVSRGISIGRAHILTPAALDVRHYLVPEEQVEAEVASLQAALAKVLLEADGPDEEACIAALAGLINDKFGEGE